MTELTLQAGETLRIRTGRRLLLVMRSESSFEVRIVKRGIGVRIARALRMLHAVAVHKSRHASGIPLARVEIDVDELRYVRHLARIG